jgi:hypothetical protein
MSTALDTLLETIARDVLAIPTLATRGRDALDFHDVGVVSLKRALGAPTRLAAMPPPNSSLPHSPSTKETAHDDRAIPLVT